jgi:hypothetical protein
MAIVKFSMPTYRGALTFVAAACLAYISSYVSLVLSVSYPELRFFGRYIFIIAVLCIFLLTLDLRYKITQFPSYFFILAFTIYYLVHCIIFEGGKLESHGLSIYLILLLGIGFWLLIKNEAQYLQILLLTWIVLFVAIVYYIKIVLDFGIIQSRITPENMGLEVNGNVLCFMSATLSILSLRIYELYNVIKVNRSAKIQRLTIYVLTSISLACLVFSFWHLNMTFTLLNLIVLGLIVYRYSGNLMKVGLLAVFVAALTSIDITNFDGTFFDQIEMYTDRLESGGSASTRLAQANYVYNQWLINPVFGASKQFAVLDGSGSSNHTFYLNILAIYGVAGFIVFMSLILSLILPGIRRATMGQLLARVLFLTMWMVGPSTYPQAIALLIMLPQRYYLTNHYQLRN